MARTKGSFTLAGAIEPLISAPLDARDKVATKAELTTSGNFPYPYVGMETYVVAEDKKYRLVGEDPTNIENWKEVAEGGGSGTEDYADLDNKPQVNGVTLSGNKTSADLKLQSEMQVTSLPMASSSLLGVVLQYTGATSGGLTHGYFYECVNNSGVYSWIEKKVQEETEYTAGDGIDIDENNEISLIPSESGDIDEIVDLPPTTSTDMGEIVNPVPTPAMTPVHYSTDEQVVGTWIDGATLYQKSYVMTMASAVSTWSRVDIGASVGYVQIVGASLSNGAGTYITLNGFNSGFTAGASVVACNNSHVTYPNSVALITTHSDWISKTVYVTI